MARKVYLTVAVFKRYQREPTEYPVLLPDNPLGTGEDDLLERGIAVAARAMRDCGAQFSYATITRYDGARRRRLWSVKARRSNGSSGTA